MLLILKVEFIVVVNKKLLVSRLVFENLKIFNFSGLK